MIKLRVSYIDPGELERFKALLAPLVVKVSQERPKGKHTDVYIDLKLPPAKRD